MGSGPFKFKSYTRGSHVRGREQQSRLLRQGSPYLDGYKFFISPETSVRAAAIRSGRAYIEFRDLPNRGGGDQAAARHRSSSRKRDPATRSATFANLNNDGTPPYGTNVLDTAAECAPRAAATFCNDNGCVQN